jgi:hypothetical protein
MVFFICATTNFCQMVTMIEAINQAARQDKTFAVGSERRIRDTHAKRGTTERNHDPRFVLHATSSRSVLVAKSLIRLIPLECREIRLHFERRKAVESSFRGSPATFQTRNPFGQNFWQLLYTGSSRL